MTTPAVEVPDRAALPSWSSWPRRTGWALLAGWAVLIVSIPFAGERAASVADLRAAVEAGDVRVVHVSGELGEGGRGFSTLDLRWREGLLAYHAEVREARPLRSAPRGGGDVPTVRAGVVDRLAAAHPDLRVERDRGHSSSFSGEVLGWRLPAWSVGLGLALSLAALGLLVVGPQPWRATRWAWFWIFGIATPLGMLAYLVLGGPTALASPPRPGASRLTGGWAFLLAFLAGSVLSSFAAALG